MKSRYHIGWSITAALLIAATVWLQACDRVARRRARPEQDIVATARAADDFNTLVEAIQAAGLAETLKGEGPFTVFAPTDEAFAKLPPGTLNDLMRPENRQQLTSILTYHVVEGNIESDEIVTPAGVAITLQGEPLIFEEEDRELKVNQARIVDPDIRAANGIIHAIDEVLMPPDMRTQAGAGL